MSAALHRARRIIVKVGSSLVTDEGRGLDPVAVGNWCRQMASLARQGREIVMVSSGAVAEGMQRLGWSARPKGIHELQAAAAVGQMGLAQIYESRLREEGMRSAQILLTHADLADRERYLNARTTLLTLTWRAALLGPVQRAESRVRSLLTHMSARARGRRARRHWIPPEEAVAWRARIDHWTSHRPPVEGGELATIVGRQRWRRDE